MANYENKVNLHVFTIMKNGVDKTALIPIFDIDSDFSENEEQFRESTLKIGYANESERCAEEIYGKYADVKNPMERLDLMLKDVPCYNSFIIGNSYHSGDYAFELTEVGDRIVLAIAYVG